MDRNVKVVTKIMEGNSDREAEGWDQLSPWSQGAAQYGERVRLVAQHCLRVWPGDVVEVGAFAGGMTSTLATLASDRTVITIDPWEVGTQNCEGWEHDAFVKNTEPFDNIEVLWMKSQDSLAFDCLESRNLSLAVVDGLHTYEACLSDLKLVAAAPLIVVDDILWNSGVLKAFLEFSEATGRTTVRNPLCKEGYIIK